MTYQCWIKLNFRGSTVSCAIFIKGLRISRGSLGAASCWRPLDKDCLLRLQDWLFFKAYLTLVQLNTMCLLVTLPVLLICLFPLPIFKKNIKQQKTLQANWVSRDKSFHWERNGLSWFKFCIALSSLPTLELMIISVAVAQCPVFISLQLSVKNCFIRGSVVRYVQLPADEVDTQLLQDAARKEAMQQKQWWITSWGRSLERGLGGPERWWVANNDRRGVFGFGMMILTGLCRIVSLIAFQRINHLHWAAIIWNQFSPPRLSGGVGFVSDSRNTSSALFFWVK